MTHMVLAVVVGTTTSHCKKIIYETGKKSLEFDYHLAWTIKWENNMRLRSYSEIFTKAVKKTQEIYWSYVYFGRSVSLR
jgi:hypothetical protein